MHSIGTVWLWTVFFFSIAVIFTIDTFILGGRKAHRVTMREALTWTIIWMSTALIFNVFLWHSLLLSSGPVIAHQKSLEFFTGYLIEESLSFDNMFVFLLIFNFFRIPAEYQRRVLLYGFLGAIFFRFGFIITGTWLVARFHWILYIFGAFLVYTGFKILRGVEHPSDLSQNPIVIWLERHIRLTKKLHEEKFFIRQNKLWYATPLFIVLVLIELSDIIFALDSIPAIFAVTTDPFIAFTSNIYAVLGLRALYFLLKNLDTKFYLLKYGVASVLIFIGFKMLMIPWFKMPILITLAMVVVILSTSMVLSVVYSSRRKE